MNQFNICRLCKDWKETRESGPKFKYGVRHYAHATCGFNKWGREWLLKLPDWQLRHFPYFLAQDLGILDDLKKRFWSTPAEIHAEGE